MAGGQWEVVGGKSKKNKTKNGGPKAKEKKNKETPNVEISAPVCESQNSYSAFIEKEKKEIPKPKMNGIEAVKNREKNTQQKKKKDKKSLPSTKTPLDEIFSSVTEEDLKNHLATVEVLCPSSPLVWLKDLASFFNVKFDAALEDPIFITKSTGYPCESLSKGVYELMLKTFSRCTSQILQLFFEYCLQTMVQDTLKGLHTLGYRVVLQCLAQEMPSVALENLSKCAEICNNHQNRQNICLSVMWAAGQAGNNDIEAGFRVWIDLMFPLIGAKTCSNYAVDYLEKLVSSDDVSKINRSILGVRDLFPILDFIYSKDLAKSFQKRLIAVYPVLKSLSYGPDLENVLRNYFPSYLRRLEPQCPQPLKEEILSSLVYCLAKDNRSYSIWRQLFSKHFIQSKLLIAHLNDHWEKLPAKFPRRSLYDTLSVFQVTNEELLSSGKKEPSVEECILINKELLSKMNSQVFSWPRITLLFILLFSLLLTYDIWIHNSFIESNAGKLLKDAGVLVICTQAGEKLVYYYGKTYKLLETNLPIITSWTQKTCGPYFESFWKNLLHIAAFAWNSTYEIRIWCNEVIHNLLMMIDKEVPVYGSKLIIMAKDLTFLLSGYVHFILGQVWKSAEAIALWLQSSSFMLNAWEVTQQYAVALVDYVQKSAISATQYVQSYF